MFPASDSPAIFSGVLCKTQEQRQFPTHLDGKVVPYQHNVAFTLNVVADFSSMSVVVSSKSTFGDHRPEIGIHRTPAHIHLQWLPPARSSSSSNHATVPAASVPADSSKMALRRRHSITSWMTFLRSKAPPLTKQFGINGFHSRRAVRNDIASRRNVRAAVNAALAVMSAVCQRADKTCSALAVPHDKSSRILQ